MPVRARFTFRVTTRFDNSGRLAGRVVTEMKEVVDDTAAAIQERAKQMAPVDTGALEASIYVSTPDHSDYGVQQAQAQARRPQATILEEVDPEFVISPSGGGPAGQNSYTAVVGAGVEYAAPNEFGTIHMPPRPYMVPAAIGQQDDFTNAMSHLLDGVT